MSNIIGPDTGLVTNRLRHFPTCAVYARPHDVTTRFAVWSTTALNALIFHSVGRTCITTYASTHVMRATHLVWWHTLLIRVAALFTTAFFYHLHRTYSYCKNYTCAPALRFLPRWVRDITTDLLCVASRCYYRIYCAPAAACYARAPTRGTHTVPNMHAGGRDGYSPTIRRTYAAPAVCTHTDHSVTLHHALHALLTFPGLLPRLHDVTLTTTRATPTCRLRITACTHY